MYDFVINIPVLKQTIADLNKAVIELNAIWQTAEKVKNNTKNSWVGQSALSYIEMIDVQKVLFNNITSKIKGLIKDLNFILGEAEKMNKQAASFAGFVGSTATIAGKDIVSINKVNIRQAVNTCIDLDGIYAKQHRKIIDAGYAADGLKYAKVVSVWEFDSVKVKINNNKKKLGELKNALEKYEREMQALEEEVCARFNTVTIAEDIGKKPSIWDGVTDIAGQIGSGLADALLGIGISISAVVSGASDIFDPYVDENYEFNSGFTFGGFIHNQNSGDAANLKMGYYTGDYNGCGWVATYNTGVLLGKDFQPADIIKYYDSRGGALVDGMFGVNPLAIQLYLKDQGIEANLHNLPSEVDSRIKDSKVSILMYFHGTGGHYITIQHVNGTYYAYNNDPKNYPNGSQPIQSIEAWLEENDKHWAAFLITIPEEVKK